MNSCKCSRAAGCALYSAYVRDCPCKECLVKASCNQLCEYRKDYWDYMTGQEKETAITGVLRDLRNET